MLIDVPGADITASRANRGNPPAPVPLPAGVKAGLPRLRKCSGSPSALLSICRRADPPAPPGLLRFAETLQAPVCTSLMGLGGFPETIPSLGMIGMHGSYAAGMA